MLRIRLSRYGKKDRPTWRVVVVESARTGKGRVSDYIGAYDPMANPKRFTLDTDKFTKWTMNGAQPTDAVLRLKGRFIDKTKDYQKEVPTKVYRNLEKEAAKKAEAEAAVKAAEDAKAAALAAEEAAKQAEIDAAAAAAEAPVAEEVTETPVAEEAPATPEEAPEAPTEEATPEAPVEEVAPEVAPADVPAEAPTEEVAPVEEAPAA